MVNQHPETDVTGPSSFQGALTLQSRYIVGTLGCDFLLSPASGTELRSSKFVDNLAKVSLAWLFWSFHMSAT